MASQFLSAAQDKVNAQKAALLQAVAEQGTAGRVAYQNAQSNVEPLRQQAVQNAALGADDPHGPGFLGGPNDAMQALSQAVAQSKQLQEQDDARRAAAGQQYFDKLTAALPILDNETQVALAQIAAQRAAALSGGGSGGSGGRSGGSKSSGPTAAEKKAASAARHKEFIHNVLGRYGSNSATARAFQQAVTRGTTPAASYKILDSIDPADLSEADYTRVESLIRKYYDETEALPEIPVKKTAPAQTSTPNPGGKLGLPLP